MFCFLGSTIGNLSPDEVEIFMREIAMVMDEGDVLLLGTDMVKDVAVLEAAYNDRRGVTAAFNKNILKVVNGHIHSNFNPGDFDHRAFYNQEEQRIEMHLEARKDLSVEIGATNQTIHIKKGESIHSENSHKFSMEQLEEMGRYGGLKIYNVFSDSKDWFNLVYYVKASVENLK
jgi:L-histidine N-alpha-methyltransferase